MCSGSTKVERSTPNPKIVGSNPATGTRREKMVKSAGIHRPVIVEGNGLIGEKEPNCQIIIWEEMILTCLTRICCEGRTCRRGEA